MVRVVIADDSAFLRQVLRDLLHKSQFIQVVGEAKNGKEAIELVRNTQPDILILDVEMPVMTGLQALRIIMQECPLPVFMFSSLTTEGASVTIKALEYGALDFLPKPMGGAHQLDQVAGELIRKVRIVALKKKTKGWREEKKGKVPVAGLPPLPSIGIQKRPIDIIALGSSTGGVQAAINIIPKLPAMCKPIVWVQHMPPYFTKSFAQRLDGLSKMKVIEAQGNERIEQGVCYLAQGGQHMRIVKTGNDYYTKVGGDEKVSGHCPSCDVLFGSVATYFSRTALGVILTGMGDDGTKGLVTMHSKGAFVIGQNEESCVVYGMPKVARKSGAVDIELDINDIADGIIKAGGAGV